MVAQGERPLGGGEDASDQQRGARPAGEVDRRGQSGEAIRDDVEPSDHLERQQAGHRTDRRAGPREPSAEAGPQAFERGFSGRRALSVPS